MASLSVAEVLMNVRTGTNFARNAAQYSTQAEAAAKALPVTAVGEAIGALLEQIRALRGEDALPAVWKLYSTALTDTREARGQYAEAVGGQPQGDDAVDMVNYLDIAEVVAGDAEGHAVEAYGRLSRVAAHLHAALRELDPVIQTHYPFTVAAGTTIASHADKAIAAAGRYTEDI